MPESARRPGQIVMTLDIPLEEIRAELRGRVAVLRARRGTGEIDRQRGVIGGTAAARGTRISVAAIRRMARGGWDTARILAEYPELRPADVDAALRRAG
jgi:uncharacterized protein (DUF433 family)